MMSPWIALGAVYGFLAVGFGAFGAHALRQRLDADMQAVYQTAVEYHFYHALALVLVGLLLRGGGGVLLQVSGAAFAVGVLLFSGSLYLLALSGVRWLGAITPLGGLAFLVGWLALAVWSLRG